MLALFLMAIAAAVGVHVAGNGAPTTGPAPGPLKASAVGEFRGISLQLHGGEASKPYETYIDQIAGTGANTICLVVAAYQENCASTSIFIDLRRTPPDARLTKLINHAHRKGLRVVLMPIVLLENGRSDEWRGKIQPANNNWDDWWEDYTNYVMHYARLAAGSKVELFMVGSELVSTEAQADRWRGLIKRVRKAYKGRVSYSANWDHYTPIQWWGDLDIVGMTTYYDLTKGDEPTVERLSKSWAAIKADILKWRKKINRPILFTEVGWPNQTTGAQFPWDYYRSPNKPDPEGQANCFEAFFRTWIAEEDVAGFLVWEWVNYPGQKTDPETDTSYVPCGKPAMDVIRRYFRYPSPHGPPASRPATRPVDGPG